MGKYGQSGIEQIGTQERVSHLSYSDLKYDLEPTVHEGSMITQLRRQGIDTEISLKTMQSRQEMPKN